MKKILKRIFKFIAILFTCLLVIGCMFIVTSDDKPTFADTGFSGGHSSGGSHSSHSSSHGGSGGGTGNPVADAVIVILILTMYGVLIYVGNKKKNSPHRIKNIEEVRQKDVNAERFIRQYLPNFNKLQFLNDQYNNYCRMQVDWMNFNMPDMKELITDELYTMWSAQLETLKLKGEQNIMGTFELESAYLTDATLQNGNLTVSVYYVIKTYDYIADFNTKRLVRGNNRERIRYDYLMKFRISLDHMNNIDKCPSCGNVITNNTSNICPFCRSQLFVEPKNWVLTEKTCLHQEYTK